MPQNNFSITAKPSGRLPGGILFRISMRNGRRKIADTLKCDLSFESKKQMVSHGTSPPLLEMPPENAAIHAGDSPCHVTVETGQELDLFDTSSAVIDVHPIIVQEDIGDILLER